MEYRNSEQMYYFYYKFAKNLKAQNQYSDLDNKPKLSMENKKVIRFL